MYVPTPTYGFGYGYPQQQYQQYQGVKSGEPLTRVSGRDEAAATFVQPNGAVALFHDTEPLMYIVVADDVGSKTVHEYRYEPVDTKVETKEDVAYVTKSDLDSFKDEIRELLDGERVRPDSQRQRNNQSTKR